jgi:hypothetical protein
VASYVPLALQSKKLWPMPFACLVWHFPLQHPGVAHSQPSVSGAVAALQSMRPALHLYEHVVPSQLAAPVFVLHALLHAPQVAIEKSEDSQPLVSGGVMSQSAKPIAQPVYVQSLPEHAAPTLVFVSHERPQPPQLAGVVICVSHPLVSGGVSLQSA